MKKFYLKREILVSQDLETVFSFFSKASNLERLTPPFLNFKILTPAPIEMKKGTLIDYRLKLHGIPLVWQSEITVWEPPYRFVDEQRKGPYRLWRHQHSFRRIEQGVLIADEVEYGVWGGNFVNNLFVKKQLERIFDYRHSIIAEIFDKKIKI